MSPNKPKLIFKTWSTNVFNHTFMTHWRDKAWSEGPTELSLWLRLYEVFVHQFDKPWERDYLSANNYITLYYSIKEAEPEYFPVTSSTTERIERLTSLISEENYYDRLMKLMEKNIGIKNYPKMFISPAAAFRELVARGFLPHQLHKEKPHDREKWYLHGAGKQLFMVLPDNLTVTQCAEYQQKMGIFGYTGYNYPIKK